MLVFLEFVVVTFDYVLEEQLDERKLTKNGDIMRYVFNVWFFYNIFVLGANVLKIYIVNTI